MTDKSSDAKHLGFLFFCELIFTGHGLKPAVNCAVGVSANAVTGILPTAQQSFDAAPDMIARGANVAFG